MTTVARLTDEIRDIERMLAPGSETDLFGDYAYDVREWAEGGDWQASTVELPPLMVAGWLGAYYASLAADQCDRSDYADLLWRGPLAGDFAALGRVLGRQPTVDERDAFACAYGARTMELIVRAKE